MVSPESTWGLATVVGISGSSYRRPGAKLLVSSDGQVFGQVSGGCLEETVKEHALQVIASGEPQLLTLDTTDQEGTLWGFGMGCQGILHVFIERTAAATTGPWSEDLHHALNQGQAVTWARQADLQSGHVAHLVSDASGAGGVVWTAEGAHHDISETFLPPVTLVVFGAGDDAIPLVRVAADSGFRVIVVDHRSAYCTEDRFPWAESCISPDEPQGLKMEWTHACCAVIQTHHFARDRDWLAYVLEKEPFYIGLLGPKERCRDIIEACPGGDTGRVHGPVGLDIGAEGSDQIAVSILAEILATLHHRAGSPLCQKEGKIHEGEN